MITKIISGGQTGADRAALDFAIKMDLPHGGWIPKGRLTEAGPLPEAYQLKEMPTEDYPARTEQNVIDSDGTLIITHGRLTGGSNLTLQMANRHARPCLHIDLNQTHVFRAARKVKNWIEEHAIGILNVAGPRASKDPSIYQSVMSILTTFWYSAIADDGYAAIRNAGLPKTVSQAVDMLVANMSLKDRATVANMHKSELMGLNATLGAYIRNQFKLWSENTSLLMDCRKRGRLPAMQPDEAVKLIIEELWNTLRQTHRIRVLK